MMFHICSDIMKTNNLSDKVHLLNVSSKNIKIGEQNSKAVCIDFIHSFNEFIYFVRVSLLITEIFDSAVFGEHCLSTLRHAWEELIDLDIGKVIPNSVKIYGALLESSYLKSHSR